MRVESPEFTEADVRSFVTDYYERERNILIERLRRIPDEVDSLVNRIEGRKKNDREDWGAGEILAHMASSAQYFGWLTHQAATKQDVGDILQMIRLRDVAIGDLSQQAPDELAKQLRESVERTIEFLEKVPYEDLRRTFDYVGLPMSGEDLIRIPLCSHLEGHIDQIEESLEA